ncbi:MAG TPA: Ppx/GppA phosphatase family protein, partial [Stellaceae bacterium]|nr:Ppx/GppA phosphatase family protein [Stellaceae bacterium]
PRPHLPSDRSPAGERGTPTYAALDLGTNNCRLLMARAAGRSGFRVVEAFSRIVRLGEGLAATGHLSEAAMGRTIEALRICAQRVAGRRVAAARYVATEACRRAQNCAEFLDRVRAVTGIAIEIISSDEEARLVVNGCAPLLDRRKPRAVVFDIGGGSTELVWVTVPSDPAAPPVIDGSISIPQGVVTFADRYGGRELDAETYEAIVEEIRRPLMAFEERFGIGRHIRAGEVQMIGSSGTVTILSALYLNLPRYIRARVDGTALDFASIARVTRRLVSMAYADRAAHPCIGQDRADLVLAGCAILEAICTLWPVGHLAVADRGIREGILMSLVGADGSSLA